MFWNFFNVKRLYGRLSDWTPQGENFYNVLRVSENSTHQEIRDAFMQLSKQYHPDASVNAQLAGIDRTAQFVKISEAYQTLSRPSLKKKYDHALWMRTMAQRSVKSGTYGFIHDFHCFGRHRAQQQFETNYSFMPVKVKPVEKPVPPPPKISKALQPVAPPQPKLLDQMVNVLATHMAYTGICGAIFGVVNARCGVNHAKMQVSITKALINKRRVKALGDLLSKGRDYFANVGKGRNGDVASTMTNPKKIL